MSVNEIHPEAIKKHYHWQLIRDCMEGEYCIRSKGEVYLPRKSGQTDADYKKYLLRAKWADYTSQAHDTMAGMLLRKSPSIEYPKSEVLDNIMKNFDHEGHSFNQFVSSVIDDNLITTFGGLFADMPAVPEGITVYDAEKMKIQPFVKYYKAENVVNWRFRIINGAEKLVLVVLREYVDGFGVSDEFSHILREQYRVLDFDEDGFYRVRIFREQPEFDEKGNVKSTSFMPFETIPVKINGERLTYIPFEFLPYKEPVTPILYGTAELNRHYYIQSADYENGVYFTTLPTAVITGHSPGEKDEPLRLGADVAIELSEEQAKAYTLQFAGEGLDHCEKAIASTQEQIGILGTRAISPDKSVGETSDAARIHRAGEHAKLASYARDVGEVFTKVLNIIASWLGCPEECTVGINVDYDTATFDPNMLNAIANLSREGMYPIPLVYDALKRGELLPENFDLRQFMLLIAIERSNLTVEEEIDLYQKLKTGEKIKIPDSMPLNSDINQPKTDNKAEKKPEEKPKEDE